MTIVIATGEELIVNANQYPDLWWALRGGGGGTFGVLTSVTYISHPVTPLIAGYFSVTIDSPVKGKTEALKKLVTELLRITPQLAEAGWGGYPTIEPHAVTGVPSLGFMMLAPNVSWAKANESLNPFFAFAQSVAASSSYEDGGAVTVNAAFTKELESFNAWETAWWRKIGLVGNSVTGNNVIVGSRLFTEATIREKYIELGDEISEYYGCGF